MLYFYFNLIPKKYFFIESHFIVVLQIFLVIVSYSFFCITIFHLNLHEHYEVMEATDTLHANNLIHIFKEDTSENVAFSSFHQFFCKC